MECEKENINVVIVPENILQAIKNSSSLNVDIADTVNLNTQKEDVVVPHDGINLPTLSNGNLWFMLSGDNIEFNTASTSIDESVCDNNCIITVENASELNNDVSTSSTLATDSDANTSSLVLYPNCVVEQDTNPECDFSLINNDISVSSFIETPEIDSSVPSDLNKSKIDNSYTITPPIVSNSYINISLPSFQSAVNASVSSELVKNNAPSINNPVTVINPPFISRQETVKHSVTTAEKGTCTYGSSKSLHKCDVEDCEQVFKSALECRKHKTTVHGKKKPYKCKYANCLWSFSTPYKLRRHLESHYKRKPYACTYPGCNAVFSSDYNQRVHEKQHYTLNPSRICKLCGEVADNKKKLATHMRDVHNEIPDFQCNICKKNFLNLAALVIHKKSHNPPVEYTCPVCEKKFTKRYYLKIHLYTHTREKPFKCDQCDCGFASLSRLNRHMWVHKENRRFVCTEENCDKTFNRLNHLMVHLRKVHHIEPSSEDAVLRLYMNKPGPDGEEASFYQCETCGLRCLTSHGLERHKLKCEQFNDDATEQERSNIDAALLQNEPDNDDDVVGLSDKLQVTQGENIIVEINDFVDNIRDDNEATIPDDDPFCGEKLLTNQSFKPALQRLVASPSTSDTCNNIVSDLEKNWIPARNLTTELPPTRYLACPSEGSNPQVTVIPFMSDLNVLNDPTTQRFLQLNEELPACVTTSTSSVIDASDEDDVLKQYVVSSHDAKTTSLTASQDRSTAFVNDDNSTDHVISTSLFDNDVSLTSLESDTCQGNHFSRSTINISDIR